MVKITKLPGSMAEVEGEISAEEFEKYYYSALKKLKDGLELPGFRKGAVPEKMAVEKFGEGTILHEAAEEALKKEWPKIIKEEGLEALGYHKVTIIKIAKGNPLGFKIEIALIPEIELPDYKSAAKEIFSKEIKEEATEEEIQKALEYVKKNRETQDPVHTHDLGKPEVKKAIKDNIEFEKNLKAKENRRMEFLDKVSQKISASFPEIMVEGELNKMISELKGSLKSMGLGWEKYLEHVKKSEEELRKEWKPQAEKRIKYGLVLRKISRLENLSPTDEMLEKKAEEILRGLPEEERKKASKESLKQYLFGRMQNELVFDFLEKVQ